MTMFLKSSVLSNDQKMLLRSALFCLQKQYYIKHGELPDTTRDLIDEVATTLHLKHENH
jgi:hypothetical protein